MKQRALNTRQKRFIENHVIKGMSIAESVRRAGYCIKSGRSEDFSSWGCRLLKTPRVADAVRKLREKSFEKQALSFAEKRSFLARSLRCDPSNPDPDLVQEIREEVDQEGNVKRTRKVVNKLQALDLDNKMAGHEFKDREPQASNPFLFIVNLSKQGASLGNGSVTLPAYPPVIEAELVSPGGESGQVESSQASD
jgi:phage terminase small subunit